MNAPAEPTSTDRTRPAGPLRRAAGLLWPALIVGYFAAAAASTATGHPWPAAIALAGVLAVGFVRAWVAGTRGTAAFVALNLALVLTVLFALGPLDALGLTVVIVQAMLAALFFRSLLGARKDLITQIAEAVRSPRSPRELAYTRGVCRGWAWLMASLAVNSLALTFLAPPRVWWWWENVCTVAIPLAFAGCEWLFRQWWLRGEEKTSIPRAVKALIHIDYQRLFQV